FAAALRSRNLGVRLAAVLDEWIDVRESACLFDGARRLRAISVLLDSDPVRVEIRGCLSRGAVADLRRLADREDLAGLLPGTFHAMGRAFRTRWPMPGPEEAIRIYR